MATPPSSGTGNTYGSFQGLSLSQIRSREGDFLIPSKLPDKFSLSKTRTIGPIGGSDIWISYKREDGRLGIRTFQGTNPIELRVKTGSVENTVLNGSPAYLIRGWWAQHVTKEEQDGPIVWETNVAVALLFQKADRWVEIKLAPFPSDSGVTDKDLFTFANSMTSYDSMK